MEATLLVLPISRYVAGDYVTPEMRASWARGDKHVLQGPNGRRELADGEPFGGALAKQRRRSLLESVGRDLAKIPAPARSPLWDEQDDGELERFTAPRDAYELVIAEASAAPEPSGNFFQKLAARVKTAAPPHLASVLFLPSPFDPPFKMTEPFVRTTGSAPRALAELDRTTWSPAAQPAVDALRRALDAGVRRKLPVVVDW